MKKDVSDMKKIEKLVAPYCDNHSGCGGASYNEVINKINEIIDALNGKEEPELREGEDERIRKAIIYNLSNLNIIYNATKEECLAWLEKQKDEAQRQFNLGMQAGREEVFYEMEKEQKPTTKFKKGDWVVYDGILGRGILKVADVKDGRYTFVDNDSTLLAEDSDGCLRPLTPADLKEQKPVEWSEEDETAFSDLMWCIEQARKSAKDENDIGNIWFAENWVKNRLKSLRPCPSWKPSEEDKEMKLKILKYLSTRCSVEQFEEVEEWLNNKLK